MTKLDRTGRRYGNVVILGRVGPDPKRGDLWKCKCDCRNVFEIHGYSFSTNKRRSCGCLADAVAHAISFERRTYSEATRNQHYQLHKSSAKQQEVVPLEFSVWESVAKRPCHYCGETDIRNYTRTRHTKRFATALTPEEVTRYDCKLNGIDRVDSQRGYELENCVSCCSMCNYMKQDYSITEFIQKIHQIANRFTLEHAANTQLLSEITIVTYDDAPDPTP